MSVLVFEKANPAKVDAFRRFFLSWIERGLVEESRKFLRIVIIASIAYLVEVVFLFTFHIDYKLWLKASIEVINDRSWGSDSVRL